MNKKIPFLILQLFSTAFVLFFYNKVIFHPNDYIFSDEGDGIKNYYTYCHHIKNNSSYTNFEGMNYPYGEHFLYTDCHPILVSCFKFLAPHFSFIISYSIGILNLIMLLSVYLTFYICYFLLKEFNNNKWFVLLFSIGISLLSPQLFRLGGHYALSYSVAIPLSWFLMIKILKREHRFPYLFLLFLNNLFWMFVHAYLGMIILFFLTCILSVNYITDVNKWKEIVRYLKIISTVIVPFLLFFLFAKLTDTHEGRTNNPSGFFQYNAEPDDIFVPSYPPLRPIFDALTGNVINLQWEARSYIGFSCTIFFIVLLVSYLTSLFKKRKNEILTSSFHSKILNISLVASFLALLFAMAFPFKQITGLLELLPFVKQFRATGRFAWPFYFTSTVLTATALGELYSQATNKKNKILALAFSILAALFNIIEAIPYHSDMSKTIVRSKNIFNKELLTNSYTEAIKVIHPSDFQAIIPLPFKYHGSESYSRLGGLETIRAYSIISYHTGIPLVAANLTRISAQESKKIVQIVSPDFYKKELQKDIHSQKPFLVVRTKEPITEYEKEIFNKCTPIYLSEEISIYALPKDSLFKNNGYKIYNQYKRLIPILSKKNGLYTTIDSSYVYYNNYDHLKSTIPFRGKGGFQSIKKGENIFAEFAPNTFSSGKKYHVSMWMYNGLDDALNNWFRFIIKEYDQEKNTWESTICFPEQSEVINGNWSLVEITFEVKNEKSIVSIVAKGKDDSTQELFTDDLLIREAGTDVYNISKNKDTLFYNNHQIILQ